MSDKSTISTSRKIYAMKHGMLHVTGIVILYIFSKYLKLEVDSDIFFAGISAAGVIIATLNVADGMKKGE